MMISRQASGRNNAMNTFVCVRTTVALDVSMDKYPVHVHSNVAQDVAVLSLLCTCFIDRFV